MNGTLAGRVAVKDVKKRKHPLLMNTKFSTITKLKTAFDAQKTNVEKREYFPMLDAEWLLICISERGAGLAPPVVGCIFGTLHAA